MIALKDYDLDQDLNQDDEDLMSEFMDYGDSTYVYDAISEIADSNVSIWNKDIFDNAGNLYFSGAYEEANAQGLMEGSNDMIRHLQAAWYEYNTQQLYHNLDALVFNYAATHLNNQGIEIDKDQEEALEDALENFDHNGRFDDIIDTIHETIDLEAACELED